MDIFISNIPPSTKRMDLLVHFHHIIHRPPFQTDPLINFNIFLFPKRRGGGRNNKQTALLTLPNVSDAQIFLSAYSQVPIVIDGLAINCRPSNQPPRDNVLARIRGTPWEDPAVVREERERERQASVATPEVRINFGRLRRDGTFTLEHSLTGTLHCDAATRRLVITQKSEEVTSTPRRGGNAFDAFGFSEMLNALTPRSTISFWYRSSAVRAVVRLLSTEGNSAELFLEFSNPATFQESSASDILQEFLGGAETIAQRMPGLRGVKSFSLGSQCLRIVFSRTNDMEKFLHRARSIQFPHATSAQITTIDRAVYDSQSFEALTTLIRDLPYPLAFQVEKSVSAGYLEPGEICERNMQTCIRWLQREHSEYAPQIFQYFLSTLRLPSFCQPPRPPARDPSPSRPNNSAHESARSRRKRNRRKTRRQRLASAGVASTLQEQLLRAADAFLTDEQKPRRRFASSVNTALYQAYHIAITPTGKVLEGPLPDQSSSILRLYENHQECFLRVSFQDEEGGKPRRDPTLAIDHLLEHRYKPKLLKGTTVAGRHFEFLGYSMSSLKDYSFIFVTPFVEQGVRLDADKIRKKFGNVPKASHRPALLAARWAQMFSASMPSVRLSAEQLQAIPDRESRLSTGQNAVFTDGCSTLSPSLARTVARRVLFRRSSRDTPSCFQFRLGGAKGVVFQDPNLEGLVLCLRPSQTKFESLDLNLNITLTSSRPMPLFLNRPLIALLEHHGVPSASFIDLQDLAIRDTQRIRTSLVEAGTTFAHHGLGTSFQLESLFKNLAQMLSLEIAHDTSRAEDFEVQLVPLKIAIAHATTHILREIKHRSRIRVAGSYTLLGVSDEWNCLNEGEIFAQVYDPRTRELTIIEGRVVITRSPQIHPGDIQFVEAVYRPELEHLRNVVVFSCKGRRSLPSMLGGGDLDGDIYNLILDKTLHPPKGFTAEAGAYEPLPPTVTPHVCGIADVVDFVVNYIKADLVGYIAITHLRISDLNGADCNDCLRLAEAASNAVDYPKVGTPVDFKSLPRSPDGPKPDFLSGEGYRRRAGDDGYYPSKKVLGKLYRRVPTDEYEPDEMDVIYPIDFTKIDRALGGAVRRCMRKIQRGFGALSASLLMDPSDTLVNEMHLVLDDYCEQLLFIAKAHTSARRADVWLSEEELICGAIMERYADPKKRREVTVAMNLQTQELTRKIRLEFSHQEDDASTVDEYDTDEDHFDAIGYEEDPDVERLCNQFNRARAAWIAASDVLEEEDPVFGAQSFAMLSLGSMLNTIKALERDANIV